MTQIFIYLRVSTDDKGQDPKNQQASCEKLAKEIDPYAEVHTFLEERSAWQSYNRPVFDNMLERAKKEAVKIIIVWDYDRVYRDRKKLLDLVGTYKKLYGIRIYSVRQKFMEDLLKMDGTIGELMYDVMLNFFGWIAQEESDKKSQRVKEAYQRKKGKNWGRPNTSPYLVAECQRLHLEGWSIGKISREKKLAENTVRKYLRPPSNNTKAKNTPQNDEKQPTQQ